MSSVDGNCQNYEDQKPVHMSYPSLSLSFQDTHQSQVPSLIPVGANLVKFSHSCPIHQGSSMLIKSQPCLAFDHAIAGSRTHSISFGMMGCTCFIQTYGIEFGIYNMNEVLETEAATYEKVVANMKGRDRYERTQRRMIKNRESAARYREKTGKSPAYIANLQTEIMKLKTENEILKRTIQLYSVNTTSKLQPSLRKVTRDASNDD